MLHIWLNPSDNYLDCLLGFYLSVRSYVEDRSPTGMMVNNNHEKHNNRLANTVGQRN